MPCYLNYLLADNHTIDRESLQEDTLEELRQTLRQSAGFIANAIEEGPEEFFEKLTQGLAMLDADAIYDATDALVFQRIDEAVQYRMDEHGYREDEALQYLVNLYK